MTASLSLERDLTTLLGREGWVPADDLEAFETPLRHARGRARGAVRPATADEVRAVVRYCYAQDIRIVAQGANTGLVAAATPDAGGDQLILSTGRLSRLTALDPTGRSILCEAGVRLSAINAAAGEAGLVLPIDLGADPSAGGMVATNTGGARLLRYGDVRRNLSGVEFVGADADATLFSDLRGLAKDNVGLHLPSIVCGADGGMGVVTRARFRLHPTPRQTAVALLTPRSEADAPALIAALEEKAGEFLTACEGMSRNAMAAALRQTPGLRRPFGEAEPPAYALLVELTSSAPQSSGVDLAALLLSILENAFEAPEQRLQDAVLDRGPELWSLRHAITGSLAREGRVIGFDVSMPRARLAAFHAKMRGEVAERFPFLRVCDFGHAGDGGDHFNVVWPREVGGDADFEQVKAELRDRVYDEVVLANGGSFSAEHGIGPANLAYYRRYVPPEVRAAAAAIRRIFDPKGLLGHFDGA